MREWARGIDGRNGRSSSSEQVSVSQYNYPCMILLSVSRNVTRHHSFLNLHTTPQTKRETIFNLRLVPIHPVSI